MVEVCGVKYSEGISKKTGKPFKGFTVYFTKDGAAKGVKGFIADSTFLSSDILQGRVVNVGDKLRLDRDNRGYVEGVEFLP